MFDFLGFSNMSKNKGFDGGSSSSRGHGFHPNFNLATNMHLMFEAPSKETILMEEVNMEPSSYVDRYSFKRDYVYDHHQANHQSNINKEHVDSRRLLVGKFPAGNGQNQQQYHLESSTTPYSNYSSQNLATPSSNHHHDRGLDCHTLGSSTMQSDFGDFTSNIGYEKWRRKAELVAHPLFEQLFSTHISCLQAGIPIRDQSRRIHAYLEHSRCVFAKYSTTTPLSNDHYYKNNQGGLGGDNSSDNLGELHKFMSHFVPLFSSYKDRLQQYVRPHTNACWELEQRIRCLTDVPLDKLDTGATVSDDDDEDIDELIKDIEARLNDESLDGSNVMGIGPLFPTEMERSLVDRVSQELKSELKEGYMEKIVDIREEILRKRKSGKLPGNTSSILKSWWMSHSKWPYPTEEDKARLVQETGLQLKQINNWFINQRKRNWLNNSTSSSSTSKSKRKRSNAGETSCDNLM